MEYDWAGYYAIVRELQPNAVIFNGPDIRWVGNERGYARESEWSVVNSNGSLFGIVNCTAKDLGSLKALGNGERLVWYPAETDVSIRPGWFYHASGGRQGQIGRASARYLLQLRRLQQRPAAEPAAGSEGA